MRRPSAAALVSALISLLVGVALAFAPQAGANQWSPSSYTSRLISLLNQTRSQHGLAPLTVAGGTTEVASAWTSHMASSGSLAHNPDLQHQLETHGSQDWTTYGENVGDGPSDNPDALFKAYMNSPEHKANILNGAYRYMGVAVVFSGDTAWNTFDFVDSYHSSTSAATTTQPKPKPKPTHALQPAPVTTPPATAPPTAVVPQPAPTAHAATHHASPAATPQHRSHHAAVRGRQVARHVALADVPALPVGSIVAMPKLPLPTPLTVPAEVAISIAAGLIGFVGVRLAQAMAASRRRWVLG